MTNEGADGDRVADEDAEEHRLRLALYGPHASAADVEQYRRRYRPEPAAAAAPSVHAPTGARRPVVLVIAGAFAVLVVVGAGLWSAGLARSPNPVATPSATARPARAVPVARDEGEREFATGAASRLHPGAYRYTIAAGDTELGIASRFHVCVSDVTAGLPLAMQGDYLTPGTGIDVELASTSIWSDGTIHCTET